MMMILQDKQETQSILFIRFPKLINGICQKLVGKFLKPWTTQGLKLLAVSTTPFDNYKSFHTLSIGYLKKVSNWMCMKLVAILNL